MTRLRFDGFELDADELALRRGGAPVRVPPIALRLLVRLARERPRAVSREELLRDVWGGVHVTEGSLHQAIRCLRRALSPHAAAIETVRGFGYRLAVSAAGEPRHAEGDPLLGRAGALSRLDAAIDAAHAGRGGLVLVTGEPGIGRSRFLREAAERARASGTRAILVRCSGLSNAGPLWPWGEVLAQVAGEDAAHEREPGARDPHSLEPTSVRRTLLDAVWDAALCVLVDDLEAADPASWQMLEGVASAADASRLLLVAALRDACASAAPERIDAAARLLRIPGARTEPLQRLSRDEVRGFASAALGREPAARRVRELHASSGGNPFLLQALLDDPAAGARRRGRGLLADPRIRRAVAAHLDVVGPQTRGWLARASAFGREFELAALATASECTIGELLDWLAPALETGVLEVGASERSLRFTHGVLAEVARAELPARERERLQLLASEAGAGPRSLRTLASARERVPRARIVPGAPRTRTGRGPRSG